MHLSAETGRDGREQGDANALLLEAGGGMLRTFWLSDRIGLPISAMLSVGYVRLKGDASSAAFAGATASGVIGDARATLGVLWRLDRYRLGLDLEGGGLFPTTKGKVEGAKAVELSGFWLGATLRAQIEL